MIVGSHGCLYSYYFNYIIQRKPTKIWNCLFYCHISNWKWFPQRKLVYWVIVSLSFWSEYWCLILSMENWVRRGFFCNQDKWAYIVSMFYALRFIKYELIKPWWLIPWLSLSKKINKKAEKTIATLISHHKNINHRQLFTNKHAKMAPDKVKTVV